MVNLFLTLLLNIISPLFVCVLQFYGEQQTDRVKCSLLSKAYSERCCCSIFFRENIWFLDHNS